MGSNLPSCDGSLSLNRPISGLNSLLAFQHDIFGIAFFAWEVATARFTALMSTVFGDWWMGVFAEVSAVSVFSVTYSQRDFPRVLLDLLWACIQTDWLRANNPSSPYLGYLFFPGLVFTNLLPSFVLSALSSLVGDLHLWGATTRTYLLAATVQPFLLPTLLADS